MSVSISHTASFFGWVTLVLIVPILGASERICQKGSLASPFKFCDESLSDKERGSSLISLLTLPEKVSLLGNDAPSIPRLGLPAYQWWNEALHGVAVSPGVNFGNDTPAATSFPQVISSAASFNRTLWLEIGRAIGDEARSFGNAGSAGRTFWTPNINIFRDPRWGRGQETPGEDPFLSAEYARVFVRALQAETASGTGQTRIKVSACCKHFFDYNLELWKGVDRFHYDARATEQDEADTYLPAFESCVRQGRVSCLMCSYNSVNGIPGCANLPLIEGVARQDWGFDGYITGDCGAVRNILDTHNFTDSEVDTVNAALSAGVDIDCDSFLPEFGVEAVQRGWVDENLVDRALGNLISIQMKLGLFDSEDVDPFSSISYGKDGPDKTRHKFLALEASRQGIVLLENFNSLLPLSSPQDCSGLAVIGPHASATEALLGNYHGTPPFVISPLEGIRAVCPDAKATSPSDKSCSSASGYHKGCIAADLATAQGSRTIIIVVGLDQNLESEGLDRESLSLPAAQEDLVRSTSHISDRIVLVLVSGGPLSLKSISLSTMSVLWVGYGGQAAGAALSQIVFGADVSGRLPVSWYPDSFTQTNVMTDNRMRPHRMSAGRTYRFYDPTVPDVSQEDLEYEFGYGLSYSTWEIASSKFTWGPEGADEGILDLKVRCVSGPPRSLLSILVFAVPPMEEKKPVLHGQPKKTLVAFSGAETTPESQVEFQVTIPRAAFTLHDIYGRKVAVHGNWTLEAGCVKGTDKKLCSKTTVVVELFEGKTLIHSSV